MEISARFVTAKENEFAGNGRNVIGGIVVREPMSKHFFAGWLIVLLALLAYLFIAVLLTGEAYTSVGVLLFILVIWLLTYKLRYKSLGNLELAKKMYADFTGAVERLKERLAEGDAPRRAEASRRRKIVDRESRRAGTPKPFSVDRTYADLIERRIRESQARQDQSEGSNDTES